MKTCILLFFLSSAPMLFGQNRMSIVSESDSLCSEKEAYANGLLQGEKYQASYDAYRNYIESCASREAAVSFSRVTACNTFRNEDMNRYGECREWLKKVLYYSPDTFYYCEDVMAILSTFFWFDSTRGKANTGVIAVANYIIESRKCPTLDSTLTRGITAAQNASYKNWQDTVKDSISTPYNPIIPTLEDLDLGILRGQHGVVAASSFTHSGLSSVSVKRNPFIDEFTLSIDLSSSTMIRIDVFDELGRSVYADGLGFSFKGIHEVTIGAKQWSSGLYYARITTSGGEVQTVKLIKQ